MSPQAPPTRSPRDDLVVRGFRDLNPIFLPRLNADLGAALDASPFELCRRYFRDAVRRDPTAGELRLLDALFLADLRGPDRVAVGALQTASDVLARTWADMMDRHATLFAEDPSDSRAGAAPPCSLYAASTLATRALYRAGLTAPRTAGSAETVLIPSGSAGEAEAVAAGYRAAARLSSEAGGFVLYERNGRGEAPQPARAGDALLLLRRAPLRAMEAYLASLPVASRPPARAAVRRGRLRTALDLCGGLDLYMNRLPSPRSAPDRPLPASEDGRTEWRVLTDAPVSDDPSAADFLLLARAPRLQDVVTALRGYGMGAVLFGRARADRRTVIRLSGNFGSAGVKPAVRLDVPFLLGCAGPRLYDFRPELRANAPCPLPRLCRLSLSPMDGTAGAERGGNGLPLPAALAACEIPGTGSGYEAAIRTLSLALSALTGAGAERASLAVSVALTVNETPDGAGSPCRPGDAALEVLLGLHRAASDLCAPILHTEMIPGAAAEPGEPVLRLAICAYARTRRTPREPRPADGTGTGSPASPDAEGEDEKEEPLWIPDSNP